MRRVGLGGIVLAMAVALTGCPTPPPGYQPPTVESVQVSPQPARPGDTLTVVIEARDDGAVTAAVPRYLITPSGTSLGAQDLCTTATAPQGDLRHVLITVTCPIPVYASNGTWQLEMFLNDSMPPTANYPGRTTRIPFEVVDGTDDRRPPQLVQYEIEPATVDQETTFTLTVRLRDEALPPSVGSGGGSSFSFTKLFAQNSRFGCSNPSFTPVSSTEVDVVVDCSPSNYNQGGRAEPGLHLAFMPVRDALGHEGNIEMSVNVLPAAAT